MSEKLEKVKELRAEEKPRCNCCQTVLLPFCEECGIDEETAMRLGRCFSVGMRCGSACGAVTGALMVLGLAGVDSRTGSELARRFRDEHGAVNCPELLKEAKERGEEVKPHCDQMIFDAVTLAEEFLARKKEG